MYIKFSLVIVKKNERWYLDGIVYFKFIWFGEELLVKLVKWFVENKKSDFKSIFFFIFVMKYSKVY